MSLLFDPGAPAKTTDTLQVEMVRRVSSCEVIEVASWLPNQTEEEIHSLRQKIRQHTAPEKFVCLCCGHNVLLRKHRNGGHYFAHVVKSDAEKAKCFYQQDSLMSLADRDRIRYHGQREGMRHINVKLLIDKILRADSNFSEPKLEKTWTTFADGWRKPDVASNYKYVPIVFEAQVSNTYPQIVAERTDFYRRQGALLIWVFDHKIAHEWRTLHSDAFSSNNRHIFVVDEECVEVSKERGEACFRIYSIIPDVKPINNLAEGRWGLELVEADSSQLIPFSLLSLDIDQQTATYTDYRKASQLAQHKVLCAKAQAENTYAELGSALQELINDYRKINMQHLKGWAALICAIESKRLGKPIGTKLGNVSGVLNLLYDNYPAFVGHLITTLDRLKIDPPEQRSGAWLERVSDFYNGVYKRDALPEPHKKSGMLLPYIYP